MTSNAQPPGDDDSYWQRPTSGAGTGEQAPPAEPASPSPPQYHGPPRPGRPPFGWRPPTVVTPSAPRKLPAQDHQALDQTERTATTFTKGVALVATAIMFVLLLLFCGRWLY